MAVWSTSGLPQGVLPQAAVPDGVRQQGHDDTSDSEFDAEL